MIHLKVTNYWGSRNFSLIGKTEYAAGGAIPRPSFLAPFESTLVDVTEIVSKTYLSKKLNQLQKIQ